MSLWWRALKTGEDMANKAHRSELPGTNVDDLPPRLGSRVAQASYLFVRPLSFVIASAIAATMAGSAAADAPAGTDPAKAATSLESEFKDPPMSARPRVWWHWMNGNVTKDGIRKDMEWMSRIGIGGLQNFDAALNTPQVVEKRLRYMTPEWKDAFRYATSLADKLDLELAIAASPGWSETGGPWVKPEDGIKKVVWSETVVRGGRSLSLVLDRPPVVTGPYQDMASTSQLATGGSAPRPQRYRDIAVYAMPEAALPTLPRPIVTAEATPLDADILMDGAYGRTVAARRSSPGGEAVLLFSYPTAQVIRSATFALEPTGRSPIWPLGYLPVLEVQLPDGGWQKVCDIPLKSDIPSTVSFAPVTGARFRLRIGLDKVQSPAERLGAAQGAVTSTYRPPDMSPTINLTEARLSNRALVNRFETKAGYAVANDYRYVDVGTPTGDAAVAPGSVVDLTGRVDPDGRLTWTPPKGNWRIIRMGWSLTGTMNHPATAEATGLEVDKLDHAAVERYITTYLNMFRDTVGPDMMGKRGLRALVTDSIEVGAFNWTPDLPAKFRKLRGYDPLPWLPALAGNIIGSRADTDRFLYDFRRTIAELLSTEHYRTVAAVAHRMGLTVYGEALENSRPSLGDDMSMRSFADIPMAAMWTYRPSAGPISVFLGDMKGAASVAHIYGQNLVAAESLTSGFNYWAHAPSDLKPVIDLEFAYGINRPIIHTSVHQPVDDKKPGLSLSIFGQFFNRNETWAEMARPWVDYIARSSYLLQQGHYAADIAYFYGEEAPLTGLFINSVPTDIPKKYGYDFLSVDALNTKVQVREGAILSDGGTRYRAIYLGGSSQFMTVATLKRLRSLVTDGATVIGRAPTASPSFSDNDGEFRRLRAELWAGGGATRLGAGRVINASDAEAALAQLGVAPDVDVVNAPQASILSLHRSLKGAEIYFLSNRRATAESIDVKFRTTGMRPEIWRADSGKAEPVSYRRDGDRTLVHLDMVPNDAYFVVFRGDSHEVAVTVPKTIWEPAGRPIRVWDVALKPATGAAAKSLHFKDLQPLTASADPDTRYFSGISTYTSSFAAPANYKQGSPLVVDLGNVGDLAEVLVNGKSVGTVWKFPYRVDISSAARRGANRIVVRVANLWKNRLIGDAQPGAVKTTFTTLPTYTADAPLRPSGLLGPVQVLRPKQ
jgi:hypothetical protein